MSLIFSVAWLSNEVSNIWAYPDFSLSSCVAYLPDATDYALEIDDGVLTFKRLVFIIMGIESLTVVELSLFISTFKLNPKRRSSFSS